MIVVSMTVDEVREWIDSYGDACPVDLMNACERAAAEVATVDDSHVLVLVRVMKK